MTEKYNEIPLTTLIFKANSGNLKALEALSLIALGGSLEAQQAIDCIDNDPSWTPQSELHSSKLVPEILAPTTSTDPETQQLLDKMRG